MPKQTIFQETQVFMLPLLRTFDGTLDMIIEDLYLTFYSRKTLLMKTRKFASKTY